nr:MAG: putative RNA dependent RNA polymerase [Guangxi sediment mito-like virus 2]
MSKVKNYIYTVDGSVKPSVQKRGSRDSVGFITKKLVHLYFRFLPWVFSQDKLTYIVLKDRILSIWDKNGSTFLVKYLKECYLIVQLYVSGNKVETVNHPLSLTGGLPRIIPGPLRSEIRKGNPLIIRGVLTALALFRIIKCPGNLKLSTITDPFKGISSTLVDYEVSLALRSLFGSVKDLNFLKQPEYLFLMSAGPNSSVAWKGTWLDIKAWSESPYLPHLLNFIKVSGWEDSRFAQVLFKTLDQVKGWQSLVNPLVLGKLHEKEEAAGKIRVFAITDIITQGLLKPLHKFLFSLLRNLETDGTFDQTKPAKRLLELKREGVLKHHRFYSYDLSAATDRLPLDFQKQVLTLLFGNKEFGSAWGDLLCKRPWYLKDQEIFYSVGQPMGALSSWAMLALSHHVVVAIAASRVGISNFTHYALLGDDIVIANNEVAKAYYHLMVEILGVDINLSKSLISFTHFEYAKRLYSVEHELTPIGPKNLLLLLKSPNSLVSVLRDAVLKGLVLSESDADTLLGKVPYYRAKSIKALEWVLKGPFGLIPTEFGLSSRLRLNNSLTSVSVDILLSAIDEEIHLFKVDSWNRDLLSFNNVIRTWEIFFKYGYMAMTDIYTCSSIRNLDMSKVPISERWDISESDLYFYMREILLNKESRLLEKKPVRRLIFDGPLIHFGFYNPKWAETVMSYITSKIHSGTTYVPTMDPFKDLSLSKPNRNITFGNKFFTKVYHNWVERKKYLRPY